MLPRGIGRTSRVLPNARVGHRLAALLAECSSRNAPAFSSPTRYTLVYRLGSFSRFARKCSHGESAAPLASFRTLGLATASRHSSPNARRATLRRSHPRRDTHWCIAWDHFLALLVNAPTGNRPHLSRPSERSGWPPPRGTPRRMLVAQRSGVLIPDA